jgi:hypothetical protein
MLAHNRRIQFLAYMHLACPYTCRIFFENLRQYKASPYHLQGFLDPILESPCTKSVYRRFVYGSDFSLPFLPQGKRSLSERRLAFTRTLCRWFRDRDSRTPLSRSYMLCVAHERP